MVTSKVGKSIVEEDVDMRTFFLVYGFYPGDETVYSEVKSLYGNKYIEVSNGRVRVLEKSGFKSQHCRTDTFLDVENEEVVANLLYKKLMEATIEQTKGADRIAVLLGGFDSALVASLLKKANKNVETFSFYYEDQSYNQEHTDTLSEYLGIKHHWIKIDSDVMKKGLLEYSSTFDQPTNWPNYVIQTQYLIGKIKKEGFDICFTGDGCDNLFYGYPGVFKNSQIYSSKYKLPSWLISFVTFFAGASVFEKTLGHPYRLFIRLLRNMAKVNPERSFLMFRVFDEITVKNIFKKKLRCVDNELNKVVKKIIRGLPTDSSASLAYKGKSVISPNRTKMICSSDSSDVALFSPYMHSGVKEMIASLPEHLLRPTNDVNDIGKYILILSTKINKLLPDEIIYQKKLAAVDAPIDYWYQTHLRDCCLSMLNDSDLNIDMKMVESLFENKITERVYKKYYPVADTLTTHVLSLLITYSRFFGNKGNGE